MVRDGLGVTSAGAEDLSAIADLESVCFPHDPWSPNLLAEAVQGSLPTTRVYVVRAGEDDALLAYAIVAVVDVDAELQRIAVAPEHRGGGIGAHVLALLCRIVAGEGATRMLLEVREHNAPALRLYRRGGFTDLGRRERYYRDGTAALVLERPLDPPGEGPEATWRMTW